MNAENSKRHVWPANSRLIHELARLERESRTADAKPGRLTQWGDRTNFTGHETHDRHGSDTAGRAKNGGRRRPVLLVPLDFAAASQEAVDIGIKLAGDCAGMLLLVHAVHLNLTPYGPANPNWLRAGLHSEAMQQIEPVLQRAQAAGVMAACAVEEGVPAEVIAKTARRWSASMILLGKPRRGFLSRWFGSGTADKVIREAKCPVLVLEDRPVRR